MSGRRIVPSPADVALRAQARQRALARLAHQFQDEFGKLFKEELRRASQSAAEEGGGPSRAR